MHHYYNWPMVVWLLSAFLIQPMRTQMEVIPCPLHWTCKNIAETKWKAVSSPSDGQSPLTITYEIPPNYNMVQIPVQIICDVTRDLDLPNSLLSDFVFPTNVTYFYFINCQLPVNNTYLDIIGNRTVLTLRLQSSQALQDTLKTSPFQGLDNLTYLNLANCGLTSLPKFFFQSMPRLETLKLTDNSLTQLPVDIFQLTPNLMRLELGNNKLVKLTEKMPGVANLQILHLYNNRIEKVTREFFSSFPVLQSVDLQSNRLVSISDDVFYDVVRLKIIKLFTNNLQKIPDYLLVNQSMLTEINLSDNRNLAELPDELLHQTTSLLSLTVERCNISVMPPNLFQTPSVSNISTVSFGHNNLREIPPSAFTFLTNLTTLSLEHNQLTKIDKTTFSGLKKLQSLNLNNNNIRTIATFAFADLVKLTTVNLAFNQITSLPSTLFDFSSSLEVLDLQHNQFQYQDPSKDPFNLPNSVTDINLSYNRMRSLPSGWILRKTFLRTLNMRYNELNVFNADDCQPASRNLLVDISFNNISRGIFDMVLLDQISVLNGPVNSKEEQPKVILENNPFSCDCYADEILNYFNNQNNRSYPFILQLDNLNCASPLIFYKRPLVTLYSSELFCEEENNCPSPCHCIKHAVGNVIEVDCRNRNLTELPELAPGGTSILRIDDNGLTDLSNINQSSWRQLTKLTASQNLLAKLPAYFPPNLVELDLRWNKLRVISEEVLDVLNASRYLKRILLQSNPWDCTNCDNDMFRDFLNGNIDRVGNVTTIFCDGTKRQLFLKPICAVTPSLSKNIIIGTVFICLFTAFGLAAAAISYYRYNHEIKVWLYTHRMCLWFVKEKELDKNKRFDAFISFSQEDAEFVASHLMPGLEEQEPFYKLCVHHRDWLAGEWIPDQIIRSVQDSRRTIVVLSKNFIKSVWGRLEFKAAHHQALQDRTNRIIILVFGDLPPSADMDPDLKMYVKFNTYLKWGDVWFWQKLRYAMPHNPLRRSIPPPSFRSLAAPPSRAASAS